MTLLRVGAVAALLGTSPSRARYLDDRGILPALPRANSDDKRQWRLEDVEAYLRNPVRRGRGSKRVECANRSLLGGAGGARVFAEEGDAIGDRSEGGRNLQRGLLKGFCEVARSGLATEPPCPATLPPAGPGCSTAPHY